MLHPRPKRYRRSSGPLLFIDDPEVEAPTSPSPSPPPRRCTPSPARTPSPRPPTPSPSPPPLPTRPSTDFSPPGAPPGSPPSNPISPLSSPLSSPPSSPTSSPSTSPPSSPSPPDRPLPDPPLESTDQPDLTLLNFPLLSFPLPPTTTPSACPLPESPTDQLSPTTPLLRSRLPGRTYLNVPHYVRETSHTNLLSVSPDAAMCPRCRDVPHDLEDNFVEMAVVNRLGLLQALGNVLFDKHISKKLTNIPVDMWRMRAGLSPEFIRAVANASWPGVLRHIQEMSGYLGEAKASVNEKIDDRIKQIICTLVQHINFDEAWETYLGNCKRYTEEQLEELQNHRVFHSEAVALFRHFLDEMPPGPAREWVLHGFT